MNIAVVGTGYVGLVVGAGLADFGLQVTCVDSQPDKIEALQRGETKIYEPGLRELVQKNLQAGRLSFSGDFAAAIKRSLVIFLTLPTDSTIDGRPDVSELFSVGEELAATMREYKVIVIKSTVPVGTARNLAAHIQEHEPEFVPFDIVSNPEFLREGSALETFLRPNRVVLGHASERALAIVRDIYRPLYLIETPFVITDNETAELIKYAANAFLATKISFINEFANLCDALGCDVHVVAKAMGLDPRIGSKFLHPGPGFGGSCFPKDSQALIRMAAHYGMDMKIVKAAIEVNETQTSRILEKLRQNLPSLQNQPIAVLGLTFKSNTDDIRQSPALRICKLLLAEGCVLRLHDPVANHKAVSELGTQQASYHSCPYEASEGASALLVLTEWNDFRNLDLARIKSVLSGDLLVDARNIYDPDRARALGFRYVGVGRGSTRRVESDKEPPLTLAPR